MPEQHILIIHQGAIGDLIVSLPSFYAIRRAFPQASIDVMGYPGILSLINKRFYADTIYSVDRSEVATLYNEQGHVHPDLVAFVQRFDKIFFFGGNAQKIAVQNLTALHGPELMHIKTFPEGVNQHSIDFQLEQLHSSGYNVPAEIPQIFLLPEDIEESKKILTKHHIQVNSKPLIAIHPGSGSARKNWPVEYYAILAREVQRSIKGTLLIIEGPADGQTVAQLSGKLTAFTPIILRSPELPVLAAILKECAIFIGNDGGITHLAAAMGIPVVAVFGPSDSRVWGPRGKNVSVLESDKTDGAEGRWITPSAVIGKVLAMLNALSGY